MDKLIVGIPTINRADLLEESLQDIADQMGRDLDKLIIIDNGKQNISIPDSIEGRVHLIKPAHNQGVAGSWNIIARMAFKAYKSKNLLMLNDDIVFGKTKEDIENIISDFPKYSIITPTNHWCTFLLSKRAWSAVGEFDENFYPAYFEDNDYGYRLKLRGMPPIKDQRMDPEVFRNSMTIEKDPDLNSKFDDNKAYYVQKWGGEPGKEKYKKSFNRN